MSPTARRVDEGTSNDHWRCVCHDKRVIIKFNGGNGLTMCERTGKVLFSGFPPGWAPAHFVARQEKDRALAVLAKEYQDGTIEEEEYVAKVRLLG